MFLVAHSAQILIHNNLRILVHILRMHGYVYIPVVHSAYIHVHFVHAPVLILVHILHNNILNSSRSIIIYYEFRIMSDEDTQSQLAAHLRSQGLDDAEFWLSEFEKRGVKSMESLPFLEGDEAEFSELEKVARNKVEKKALKRFLKIEEKKEASKKKVDDRKKEEHEKDRKKLEERRKEVDKLMNELDKARKEGKDRHDARVQKTEADIRDRLQISPKSWISDDNSLEDLISKLNSHLQISGKLQQREKLSESMLLQKASGGRVLQGVYLTKKLEDQLEVRDQLLEVPKVVLITGAAQAKDIIEQFSSTNQEDEYRKTVEVLGHSVAVATKIPVYGSCTVGVGASYSDRKEDEEVHQENRKETYSSTIKFSTLHVASYSFKNGDLKLSNDAMKDLEEISKMLRIQKADSPNVEEACKRFFRRYGSHANRGPLSFGGCFKWKCSSKGFQSSEIESVKKLQSNAVTTTAGVSFAGFGVSTEVSMETVKGEYSGSCSKKTLASTHLEVSIDGGPPEAADLPLWKSGLVANNSTWILTDRGQKLEAVWDIIRRNHQRELGDVRDALRTSWEKITGLNAEQDLLSIFKFDPESILDEVSQLNEKNLTPHQIESTLDRLVKVREDISSKTSDPSIWINEYISKRVLQDFFESIVDAEEEPSKHVKFLMQQLLVKEELKQVGAQHLPCIDKISDWLYKSVKKPNHSNLQRVIVDLQSFEKFLKETLDNAKLAQLSASQKSATDAQITTQITQAILHLQSLYKGKYESVLIAILVSPFQYQRRGIITMKPLTLKDLEDLHERFSEQRMEFNQHRVHENLLHLQVYLLQLLVKICSESQVKTLLKQVRDMMDHFNPTLDKSLFQEINKVINSHSVRPSLALFKRKLNSLITTHQPHPSPSLPEVGAHSLQSALKTKVHNSKVPKSDQTSVFNSNKEAYDLFKKLDLCKHYPMKLQLKDALCVRSEPLELSLNQACPTSPQELPHLVLHKLMAYDHRCRSDLMPKIIHCKKADSDDEDEDEDDDDEVTGEHETIHPVDSLLALLICSDNFLRQDLLSRLAKCQLAVPFILPDPFTQQLSLPLWAMRSIIKDWKCIEGLDSEMKVVDKTSPVINYRMPIISFIRFGKHQKRGASKSKLLNDVISDGESHYDHFFHRDCAGGQSEVLLGKGLVDMCWYLSSGKPNEAFPDAVTFLNLHGDAREYPRQSRFLSKISFMCFVLLTEKDLKFEAETIEILKEFASSPGGITVLNDTEKSPTSIKSEISKVVTIRLTDKNANEIKISVQKRIKKKLQGIDTRKLKTLEECCVNTSAAIIDSEILIDEGSGSFKEGLDMANEVQSIVTSYKAKNSSAKEEMLPLHGGLWQTWASKDKELYRQVSRGSKTVNDYTDEIKKQKRVLRLAQLKHVESLTPVMETFIISLLKLQGPSNRIVRNYFLQCLKLGLNDFSRDRISRLQQQYQSARIKLGEIQEKTDIREGGKAATKEQISLMNQYKGEMEGLQKCIIQASFGLEHLLRELGQIYEATAQPSQIPGLSRLPEAAAELLIEGYPLELMDGDAAHVPLRWVSTVITEVASKLGDPNVFVLSILGLQSTGKSTMLNTAFGLQFNVSSGRCTRGAFMQLLPLDEQLKKQTDFSYVLIVDTEGLRAPELDSLQTQKHDNELATFVIGLANMTLINIYGEVPGDMDDILQTSVHAFLRMSQVIKYRKSCQFIHQNAGSGKNTEVGRANFTKKLNKFTVDAAREENLEGQYETFNDVIKFNDLKDVHHFPGLWKGDPPMAPLNPGYSDAAQKLKLHLIEILNESRERDLPLSIFKDKVDDLWEALLKENFVFSFKNTLEITAYNSLETQYSQWEWKFRAAMMTWERKEENEITTAELSTVSQLVHSKCKELDEHVHKLCGEYKSEMDKYFSGSKQGDTIVQWKSRFETKLITLRDELKSHAESHCKKLGVGREAISKFEKERKKYTELMTESVQDLLASLKQEQKQLHANLKKGKLDQPQLRKILTLDLFNPDNLKQYTVQGLITGAQQDNICKLVRDCRGSLTVQHLTHILVGGVLSTEQVIEILNQGRQSERELETKFNSDWVDMLNKLPYVPEEPVNVEAFVESTLLDFVRGYDGQLLSELRKTSLKKRGASLRLAVEEKKHYKTAEKSRWIGKQATRVYTYFGGTITDPHQMEAQEITDEILEKARSHLKSTTDLETDFNPAFTLQLLHALDLEIDERASKYKKNFTFTQKYKLDVYLSACGYAVLEFENMAASFQKKNDPRLFLETEIKGPLFSRFKNQYYQKKAEEGIANTLCAHFDGPIRTQVRKSLGSTIVEQMKNSEHHFKSKMALKVKILTDLHREDDFNSYMVYVTNVKRCLEERLKSYTIEYCDYTISTNTRLQILAKEDVSRLVQFIENEVTVSEASETNFSTWLEAFSDNVKIRRELGFKLNASDILGDYDFDSIQKLSLENVKYQIKQGLANSKKNLHASFDTIQCQNEMENWKDKPHELLKKLVGCTEQCPFCGEQCDLQDADHSVNHRIAVHRSGCLAGYKNVDTNVMDTEFCPAEISGQANFRNKHTDQNWVKFNEFQKIYPKWTITPDVTSGDSLYWMLFIGKYKDEIAKRFGAKPPKVPKHWSTIPWDEVEANLKKLYNL